MLAKEYHFAAIRC